jgi:GGDEF domain-containing protein
VGVSAGAATYPADGETIDELLAVADQRMYEDKVRRQAQPWLGREALRRQATSRRVAS